MGKREKKQSSQLSLEAQKLSNQQLQADFKRQEAVFQQIKPLADFLVSIGIDPIKFLSTPQGIALLAPQRAAIGAGFDQARTNLVDMFAGAGFSPGSGQAAGPFANLFGQEAQSQSDLLYKTIADSLNLGLQGANILQGQQAVFNPAIPGAIGANNAQSIAALNQPSGLAQSLIGAGGAALSGFLGNPNTFKKNKGGVTSA